MDYCGNNFMKIYELLGTLLLIFKCIVPLLIIVFGIVDFFGLVVIKKDNNKLKMFIIRIISGIVIFFMPTIITIIFERVGVDKHEYSCMYECILDNNCVYKN